MQSKSEQTTPIRSIHQLCHPDLEFDEENDRGRRKRRNSAPGSIVSSATDSRTPLLEDDTSLPRPSSRTASRPSFVVPKKDQILRLRKRRNSGHLPVPMTSRFRRALSPAKENMRAYFHAADEKIEDMMERLDHFVHEKAENAAEMMHTYVQKLRDWKACHFDMLPHWMRDNDYLHFGHRPELPSFAECFKSIFRIHTETGNIWTHLIGFIGFVVVTIIFYVKPFCDNCHRDIHVNDKLIFLCFFIGAILCLACSTLFHTLSCHSKYVSTIFSRLDYAGIALLIVGSTIPWLYYGFYCQFYTKLTYITAVSVCGLLTLILLMWEKFDMPEYRTFRAVTFVTLALVSALPIVHFIALNGIDNSIKLGSLHKCIAMGALYLTGAFLYAARIPERWLPGKCDIWFQSHQLFHLLVVAAASVHYDGISEMALHRVLMGPHCPTMNPEAFVQ